MKLRRELGGRRYFRLYTKFALANRSVYRAVGSGPKALLPVRFFRTRRLNALSDNITTLTS